MLRRGLRKLKLADKLFCLDPAYVAACKHGDPYICGEALDCIPEQDSPDAY